MLLTALCSLLTLVRNRAPDRSHKRMLYPTMHYRNRNHNHNHNHNHNRNRNRMLYPTMR
jgi:hypothetical protein